ncbi:sialate O-acetylesterase [Spirosoma fluminis]
MYAFRSSTPWAKKFWLLGLGVVEVFFAVSAYAQLSITFPVSRLVFQRSNANQAYITVAGVCAVPIDRVEVRLLAVTAGQGQSTDWAVLDESPTNGQFGGRVLAAGGWYRLEVRAWAGGSIVAADQKQPVGVGEVFAIAGQSNGQGIWERDAVDPADERVVCAPHFNLTDTIRLPLPFYAAPVSATSLIGPRGQSAWCWGRLGDRLAARFNVPVLFYNAAWSGTAVRNWRESITVDSTATSYNDYFRPGMPYGNLKRIVQDYARLTGLRAVLWHQGEAEFYDTDPSAAHYAQDLETVIRQSRRDAGFDLTWVVARVSMDDNLLINYNLTHYEPVIAAQNYVIQHVDRVYPGPDTDTIQMPRTDGVHFSGEGLRLLGDAWNNHLTNEFFQNVAPLPPVDVPSTDLAINTYIDAPSSRVNDPVRVTITVRNEGAKVATNVWLRCELPAPFTFVSGTGLTHMRGLILAKLAEVTPTAPVSVTFLAVPTQEGTYHIAAEIARADQLDTDSRPNTSIGDGQDDVARVTFRTRQAGTRQFSVPISINAPPLPPVASNQPIPDPTKADLSLTVFLNQPAVSVGDIVSISMSVGSQGGSASGQVNVVCILPTSLSFIDGTNVTAASGQYYATISNIAPGRTETVWLRARALQSGNAVIKSQLNQASIGDPDSTPGNGYDNGEDDTAQVTLRIR